MSILHFRVFIQPTKAESPEICILQDLEIHSKQLSVSSRLAGLGELCILGTKDSALSGKVQRPEAQAVSRVLDIPPLN